MKKVVLAVLVAFSATPTAAQPSIPAELQASILTRMLAYDRTLKSRAGTSVGIGIVFKANDKESAQSQQEMVAAFKAVEPQTIAGLPMTVSAQPYKDAEDLAAWIGKEGLDVLYVAPGLGSGVEAIRNICQQKKIVSMSPVRAFVEQGLAIGLVLKGESPRIVVNRAVAEASGMELDSKLLYISDLIR
jgi:hypothetical protein